MKLYFILLILFFFYGCSFDDKSGIWKNANIDNDKKKNIIFKDFKKLSTTNKIFDEIIPINSDFIFKISGPLKNQSWTDIFYDKSNNTKNFSYSNLNNTILKSKKLSKYKINQNILFESKNLILNDQKGNLIIFSPKKNLIINKFNFYKKEYKHIKKKLNLIVEKNIIYISDNIGYIYAYNYIEDRLLWAKNYKIPFRSNLKLLQNRLIAANQNNDCYVLEKKNGNLIKLIPSENTAINNKFVNNISLSSEGILFLNTYGSLYSINNKNLKLNWFLNLNKSIDLNANSLFDGVEIVNYKNKALISSNQNFYILDVKNGSFVIEKNFSLKLKPVINNNYVFLITKNNLLISMSLENGKIIYSYDLNKKITNFIKVKNKNLDVKNLMLVNNNIFIFLNSSYIISLNLNGDVNKVIKLSSYLNSNPIIIDNSLLYLNKKNKLIIVN